MKSTIILRINSSIKTVSQNPKKVNPIRN